MAAISITELMADSGVGFGTSGARGLVRNMTDLVCYAYTRAFLQYLQSNQQQFNFVAIAGDLRPSSPRIMAAVTQAVRDMGLQPVNCGFVPSPTVALYGIEEKIPAIMVTGSHIPDDRNGIKFNSAIGEITKADEQGIRQQVVNYADALFNSSGQFHQEVSLDSANPTAIQRYKQRYIDFFGSDALNGETIGVYQHSGVARDLLVEILDALGATVIKLGRSDQFIPVDTEAIRPEDDKLAAQWANEQQLSAIVSTDGDADRPLISNEKGVWLRGDTVGPLCARFLGAQHIVTPVSCNSAVDLSGWFQTVRRTRIGSPYVIEGMEQLTSSSNQGVVGYEANGGFLIQDPLQYKGKTLAPLPTRDAVIVILALVVACQDQRIPMSKLVAQLPQRYTFSDRIKEVPQQKSSALLQQLTAGDESQMQQAIADFFDNSFGKVTAINQTDGLRIHFDNATIVHIRPSGNAPELRCYSEADSYAQAQTINQQALQFIRRAVS